MNRDNMRQASETRRANFAGAVSHGVVWSYHNTTLTPFHLFDNCQYHRVGETGTVNFFRVANPAIFVE